MSHLLLRDTIVGSVSGSYLPWVGWQRLHSGALVRDSSSSSMEVFVQPPFLWYLGFSGSLSIRAAVQAAPSRGRDTFSKAEIEL